MTLESLRDELRAEGFNKHVQVETLIKACIGDGMTRGSEIVATVTALGYEKQHVGLTLDQNTGSNPDYHSWYKDDRGRYRLH